MDQVDRGGSVRVGRASAGVLTEEREPRGSAAGTGPRGRVRADRAVKVTPGIEEVAGAGQGGGGRGAFDPRRGRRRVYGAVFAGVCLLSTAVGLVALLVLLADVWRDGSGALSWSFLTSYPSRIAARAGIRAALWGSVWVLVLTAVITFPIGVGTAIWLEEYAPRTRWTRLVQLNIANLAGVPAIVYGMLGLAVFVRAMALGRSVISGALTLALLILPVIIIAAQEAIRAVPVSIRLGAYALGATRWQAVRHQVLPQAMPGASPLILIGALAFVPFVPERLTDPFTVLPIQIFNWISRPQPEFHELAAAAGLVLLALLLTLNAAAVLLRNRYTRKS